MIVRICMSKVRPTLLLARRSFSVKVKSGPVVTPVVVPPPKIEPENDSPNEDGDQSAGDDAKGQFYQDCWHFAKTLLPAGIVLFGLKYILCVPIIGRSMSPQFNPGVADYGDTVIFLPRLRRSVPLVRGEIYLFNDPTDRKIHDGDTEYILKRCIAIEGDTIMTQKNDKIEYTKIPEGHCWLESDNWTYQAGQYPDSLKFGAIPNSSVWGKVVWCYRRKNIFPTFWPHPQNYDYHVPIQLAIPHQRVMISRDTSNPVFLAINEMKNLPNKEGMDLLPKGRADKEMEGKSTEEKQGWTYNHDFTVSTDISFIKNLEKRNMDALKDADAKFNLPGTSILESRKE